jgi:hypothetical protein
MSERIQTTFTFAPLWTPSLCGWRLQKPEEGGRFEMPRRAGAPSDEEIPESPLISLIPEMKYSEMELLGQMCWPNPSVKRIRMAVKYAVLMGAFQLNPINKMTKFTLLLSREKSLFRMI